jgi:hypothetical protein
MMAARPNRARYRARGAAFVTALLWVALVVAQVLATAPTSATSLSPIIGTGSSFAANEIQAWVTQTELPPYQYPVTYTSYNSSDGRFEFAHETVNYAVSDIPYQTIDTAEPSFPFVYVPVTAGGLSFMYNLPHLACQTGDQCDTTLQLSSYTACALLTGGITNWDSSLLQADNPGLALPNLAVAPVIRIDLSGDNFVLQQWCIAEQPTLWADFVNSATVTSYPNQVTDLSATQPRSDWPLFPAAIQENGSAAAAGAVTANVGAITAVETSYAIQAGFPYARVENASGYYTLPTPLGVDSALAYATQDPCPGSDCGIQQLNFNGAGRWVYNPSTYSYLLAPATTTADDFSDALGTTLSEFFDYALTIGQQPAPQGYAGLGLSLEQYGINTIQATIPGAVAPTSDEQSHYANGDFTPAEVEAGDTTPVAGTTGPSGGTGPAYSATSSTSTSSTSTSSTTSSTVVPTTTIAPTTTTTLRSTTTTAAPVSTVATTTSTTSTTTVGASSVSTAPAKTPPTSVAASSRSSSALSAPSSSVAGGTAGAGTPTTTLAPPVRPIGTGGTGDNERASSQGSSGATAPGKSSPGEAATPGAVVGQRSSASSASSSAVTASERADSSGSTTVARPGSGAAASSPGSTVASTGSTTATTATVSSVSPAASSTGAAVGQAASTTAQGTAGETPSVVAPSAGSPGSSASAAPSATGTASSGSNPLAYTGFGGLPIGIGGASLAAAAETLRRLARRRRR